MTTLSFDQVQAAIGAGRPETFPAASTAYAAVITALQQVSADMGSTVDGVVGRGWTGPAATAFAAVAHRLAAFAGATGQRLRPYPEALTAAGTALGVAQADLAAYAAQVARLRATPGAVVDEAAIDAGAQAILDRLASAYRSARARLVAIPATPADAAGSGAPTAGHDPATGDPGPAPDPGPGLDRAGGAGGPVDLGVVAPPRFGSGVIGVPRFGLSSGGTDPGTRLTGLVGPYAPAVTAPPPVPPPPPLPAAGGGAPLPAAFGLLAVPGGGADQPGTRPRSVLTSVGRLPGVGAQGYTRPPDAEVTVRGGLPPSWSQYGRAGLGRGDARQRTTTLIGDEDWTDPDGVDGAVGRPAGGG